jgi:squalene cyclase
MKPRYLVIFLPVIAVCLLTLRGSSPVSAQGGILDPVNTATKDATRRGLEFLKTQQNQDGSFGSDYQVAASSLAGLAFLGFGQTYNRGEFCEQVRKTVDYLLSQQDKWGYIDDNQCRMHGHGYATLFLAEAYGNLPPEYDKRVKKALQMAVGVIISSQSPDGGWYYYPSHLFGFTPSDEGSVTVTQVQALRSARNAGINVPKEVIEKGKNYVRKCMGPNGCRYTLRGGSTSYTLTAAAVSVLNAAGEYQSKELEMGLNVMRRKIASVTNPLHASEWMWYGNLYACQAMYQAGGKDWDMWYPKSYELLLSEQRPNGSWGGRDGWGGGYGESFSTAIGCLMLETPLCYLPIFQR